MRNYNENERLLETVDAVARFTEKPPIAMYHQKTSDGLSAGLWEHSPRSQTFEGHKNTILAVSLRGESRMEKVKGGSTVWRGFAPGTTVVLRASEATDWVLDGRFEMLHVYLNGEISERLGLNSCTQMATPFRDPVIYQIAQTAAFVLRESEGRGNFVEPMLDAMRQYCLERYVNRSSDSDACAAPIGEGLPGYSQRKLEDFIQKNLGKPILVDQLAALVNLSPAHFSRAFRGTYSISPHKFLLERRIDRAAELLQSTMLSISEIAALTGFSSPSHMGIQFKKRMAKSPSQFRRCRF